MRGSVLGVIGLGKIGSLVARDASRARHARARQRPGRGDEAFAAAGAERSELDALLETSDVDHAPRALRARLASRCSARDEFAL